MIRFLSHVFKYLDRFYVKRLSLPELKEVGDQVTMPPLRLHHLHHLHLRLHLTSASLFSPPPPAPAQNFHEIVFNAVKRDVRAAVLEMVRKEREGEQIDRKLIKQVVEIFVEMGSSRTGLEVRMSTAPPARRTARTPPPRLLPRLTAPLLTSPPRSSSSRSSLSRCTSPTSRSSCSPPPPTSTRASRRSGPRRTRSPTTW
jgi:hypothetical protein